MRCDEHIFNIMRTKRIYGVASAILGVEGKEPNKKLDFTDIYKYNIFINVMDPLNTSGSIILNQDPNASDFQQPKGLSVNNKIYSLDRCVIVFNESPLYLDYSSSGFGFVGRSVYQRALFPLKSYIRSLITNDLVLQKAGVMIAKVKNGGSAIDNLAQMINRAKAKILKIAKTGNVIYIDKDEEITTLDLQNVDAATAAARKNIIEDLASSAAMPPKLLLSDSFASVLANGTEDYKELMLFIQRIQIEMKPLYEFFDRIVMHRAWNPEFYLVVQDQFPSEYGGMSYTEAFYQWKNSFSASFPSLMEEPESEKIKVDEARLRSMLGFINALLNQLDPENKSLLMEWVVSNINEMEKLFPNPLEFDLEAFAKYTPPEVDDKSSAKYSY